MTAQKQTVTARYIAALQARIDALTAENAELKRDAERYRWLRMWGNTFFNSCTYHDTSEIDAEIDAEIVKDSHSPISDKQVLFRYSGKIYNRPVSRGLCLGENMDDLCDKIPEGHFHADIVVRFLDAALKGKL